jgi:hypothetical protein
VWVRAKEGGHLGRKIKQKIENSFTFFEKMIYKE